MARKRRAYFRPMRHVRTVCAVLITTLVAAGTAAASDRVCLSAPVPAASKPAQAIRFGITPLLAGTSGAVQKPAVPEDQTQTDLALQALDPPGHQLVMRINRVFESDGQAGIDRAVSLEQHYSQLGFGVESQVRYHPTDAENGDMNAWVQYVRAATAALAQNPSLVALTITNEVNFPTSPNTSDGAYKNALDALVLGIVAARQQLAKIGRTDVASAADTFFELQWADAEAPSEEFRTFATELAHETVRRLAEADALIADKAERWRPERMAVLDRLILRMAICELMRDPETPRPVIINEALELARTFSGEESVRFVNGMLDAIRKKLDAPR